MDDSDADGAGDRDLRDRMRELRAARTETRRARRRARLAAWTDFVYSIPPGVGIRIGG
ncbi:hypothetical protein [Microbacterium immunditiarum]|uniref:Uncharacterized protein n=1 Tax=Microbacterium immunditiarum TaxID=337480 RepID=A0A7Y9KHR6_9MICO|nr:hypothetical protein [Microbacterium immunditiarum]NYE19762.1 hypothetical protein [Microbacterium immunditiarum]